MIQFAPINYVAVIAAAIASMVLGFLWYGPLFGKKWIAMMGWKPRDIEKAKKKGGMGTSYAIAFAGSLVMALVLAYFVQAGQAVTALEGAQVGFWAWLGFIATVTLGSVLWEGKTKDLWLLNNAYQLLSLMIMGAIVAVM